MKTSTSIIMILAIVVGSIAALMARGILLSQRPAPQAPGATVVIAAKSLSFGAAVTKEVLTEAPWPAAAIPDGSFASIDALLKDGERVALTQIAKNEPILNSRVTGPGQKASLSALIEPGMRAVAVRVDDVRGVAGFVMPGDRVDVALTRSTERNPTSGRQDSFTDILLHNVRVLAIDQLASERQEKAQVAKAVTLEVSAQQGQKLILAGGAGTLSLILREAGGGHATEQARRVTLIDLESGAGGLADKEPKHDSTPSAPQSAMVQIVRGSKVEQLSVYHDAQ